jgi:hypothetical protein
LAVCLGSEHARAFTLKTGVDAGARWTSLPISLQLTTQNLPSTITDGSEAIAIHRAAKTWSRVSGSNLSFRFNPQPSSLPCATLFASRSNVICFFSTRAQMQTVLGSTVSSTVVAIGGASSIARLKLEGAFVFINEQDFRFRTDQFDTGNLAAFDLESVILRELGQVAGLDVSRNAATIMHPLTSSETSSSRRTLHEDDIRGAQFLYPANEVLPGASCGTIQLDSLYFYLGLLGLFTLWIRLRKRFKLA